MPDLPSIDVISQSAGDAPWLLRGAVGAVGTVLCLAGARVYRVALMLAAFGVGVVGALFVLRAVGDRLAVSDSEVLAIAFVAGGVSCIVTAWVHRIGLLAIGGVVGGTLATSTASWLTGEVDWWVPTIGGLVGSLALSWGFQHLLKVLTPLVGGVLVAFAAGQATNVWLILVAWAIGAVVQIAFGARKEA